MNFIPYENLQYLHGKPEGTADLRTENTDFKVFELLPFAPSGEGEHLMLEVEKSGCNTGFVAKQLAKFFGVKDLQVTYAGLKDRHAVTRQWFGVHIPGKDNIDLSAFQLDGVTILQHARHNKKLKIGALIGNRFELTLRNVSNVTEFQQRFTEVCQTGVPNYFGEQRFGHGGNNLSKALSLFEGQKIRDKKKRSMYLSAARSYLFNQTVSARVLNNAFLAPSVDDVFMLAGSQSIFNVENDDEMNDIQQRFIAHDIDVTAPMWGRGELRSSGEIQQLESRIAKENEQLAVGLEQQGLKQERRRIRLNVTQPSLTKLVDKTIKVAFMLPAGCYATTVLREVVNYQDASEGQQ
ncbi:tRNA pseudouridine(13) synthase TruD [Thalassotalea euphylliae]|uniref:tRNA pseudouridine(13) synthase TruD n=1 Tax=Thalassotalea euphylliae TaxID=1655234 RepID=UPI0036367DAC